MCFFPSHIHFYLCMHTFRSVLTPADSFLLVFSYQMFELQWMLLAVGWCDVILLLSCYIVFYYILWYVKWKWFTSIKFFHPIESLILKLVKLIQLYSYSEGLPHFKGSLLLRLYWRKCFLNILHSCSYIRPLRLLLVKMFGMIFFKVNKWDVLYQRTHWGRNASWLTIFPHHI